MLDNMKTSLNYVGNPNNEYIYCLFPWKHNSIRFVGKKGFTAESWTRVSETLAENKKEK